MKRYVMLPMDFYKMKPIKAIRKLEKGDTYIILLLHLASKFQDRLIQKDYEKLAKLTRVDIADVKQGIKVFSEYGLIAQIDDIHFVITYFEIGEE